MAIVPQNPSGYFVYHQINIQNLYLLSTWCIYVFYMDLWTL
jgi:hypothetical protein